MAEFTPNFNLKKPNEYEFYNIDDFNGNMDIIDQKLKEAGQNEQLQSDVTEIKTDIGSPSDISSSPTIFGKLAEIKETLTTKFADIISKITGIDSKIGTTTDTGGTSSAGGIFAKLNKLLTDWTTTRASRIDSIYTNTTTNNTASTTGTLSQKLSSAINTLSSILTNTSSSTTSSSTGTLSQKLNYLKSLLENTTYGLNALKNLIIKTQVNTTIQNNTIFNKNYETFTLTANAVTGTKSTIVAKFIAPVSGLYKLNLSGTELSKAFSVNVVKLINPKSILDNFEIDMYELFSNIELNGESLNYMSLGLSNSDNFDIYNFKVQKQYHTYVNKYSIISTLPTVEVSNDITFNCKSGEFVILALYQSNNDLQREETNNFSNVNVTIKY